MTNAKTLCLNLGKRGYGIYVGKGLLDFAKEVLPTEMRALIVTDSGVPEEYSKKIAAVFREAKIITFPEGEKSKTLETYETICREMLDFGLQRKDIAIAVGGGVVGDITGFAASTYMRGIDFYNIPTTLLSQVDSSVGGKCGIDFGDTKNIIGTFYQPKAVIIDTDTLETLDKRQIACGKAEIIKMALTRDRELFEKIAREGINENNVEDIILSSLKIKAAVVEEDERESGLRKILNFGHTLGHGIEVTTHYLHGECVALGMIPFASKNVRASLAEVLKKEGLPTEIPCVSRSALEFIKRDKKSQGDGVNAVFVEEIGKCFIKRVSFEEIEGLVGEVYNIGKD